MAQRQIDLLDSGPAPKSVAVLDADGAIEVMCDARRIALIGASPKPWRASNSVMHYLMTHGYEVVPVNPKSGEILGQASYPTLEAAVAATGTFDIVDVFRHPDATPDIARSAVATGCQVLWLQQGVINAEAVSIAQAGGLAVVMDRCTAVLHQHLRRLDAP